MRDLLLVVPSRGRPQNIQRLLQCMADTCTVETDLLVGLDADDPSLPEYLTLEDVYPWRSIIEPNLHQVVAWINRLAVPEVDNYRNIGQIGDDNVLRTKNWDKVVCDTLSRPDIRFCFGDDAYPGRIAGSLSCHVFMRSSVVKALGYMGPPSIRHMYVDPVWMAWGRATGIQYLPDIDVEHLHYSCGKSAGDESYNRSSALMASDCEAYNKYMALDFNRDVERINGAAWTAEEIDKFRYDLNIPRKWGDVTPWNGGV